MSIVSELRHALDMTQEQFAEFCDISRSSIARYDAGLPISRENAVRIASACKVPVDLILGLDSVSEMNHADEYQFLSKTEKQIVTDYRNLSCRGRERVQQIMCELSILYPDQSKPDVDN